MAIRLFEMNSLPVSEALASVPFVASQDGAAVSGASAQSSAFGATTRFVIVQADEVVKVEFGSNPTADTNSYKIAADQDRLFAVTPGDKVAFISG